MNECRKAFEKWADHNLRNISRYGDGYKAYETELMWHAWQAAWNYKEKSDEA